MEFYRTFIALPIAVGEEVHEILSSLKDALFSERISWVNPERFHLTLRFLGDTPLDQVEKIGKALLSGVSAPRFRLQPDTVGLFGPRKKPRVLWIGFEDSPILTSLHESTQYVLSSCGIPFPDQPYRPHLTLGRIRSIKELSRYGEAIDSVRGKEYGSVAIDRLVYYRSVTGSEAPVYTPLYEVEFNEGGLQ